MSLIIQRSFFYSATVGSLTITSASPLTAGTQGSTYSQSLVSTGGTPPYTYRLTSGALNPYGGTVVGATTTPSLSLSYTGNLIGIPLQNAQTDSFTVEVKDAVGATATKAFSFTANSASLGYDLQGSSGQFLNQVITGPWWASSNAWGGRSGYTSSYLQGFNQAAFKAHQPYPYVSSSVAGYPFIGRGWYKSLSFYATTGGTPAPLQNSGIQISALTKAKIRCVSDTPIDRTTALYWGLWDIYVHSIANPDGSGDQHTNTDANNPVMNIMILPHGLDTSGNFEFMMNTNGSATAPSYGTRVVLDGKVWFYKLLDQPFAQSPVSGHGTWFNTIVLFPSMWNDCKQWGSKYFYTDLKQLLLDLAALSAPVDGSILIPLTTSHYLTAVPFGWEVNAGGTTPDYYGRDLQVALQSEADPVINTTKELAQLISRNLPTTAIGGTVFPSSSAVTADYNQYYRSNFDPSSGTPAGINIDCSSIPSGLKAHGVIAFNGEKNAYYSLSAHGYYGILGDFTIEGNTAGFTAGVAPTSDWTTLKTIAGNVKARLAVDIGNWQAYNSLRIPVTSKAPNADNGVDIKADIYSVTTATGLPDGILLLADSIGNKIFQAGDTEEGGAADYFGNIISLYTGHTPMGLCAGISGWALNANSQGYQPFMPWLDGTSGTWIDDFPCKAVYVALGTNDAAAGVTQSQMNAGWTFLAARTAANGQDLILPRQFYSKFDSGATSATWKGYLETWFAANSATYPNVMLGPDLHTIGAALVSIIFDAGDDIHPGVMGQAIMRSIVADWFGRVYYLGQPAASWVHDFSAGTGVGGR